MSGGKVFPPKTSQSWSVSEAKNQLSRVLEYAHRFGPQLITNRGEPDSYLVPAELFRQWQSARPPCPSLEDFLLGLSGADLPSLDTTRATVPPRDSGVA